MTAGVSKMDLRRAGSLHVSRPWIGGSETALLVLALLPVLGATFFERGLAILPTLAIAFAVVFAWLGLFAHFRARRLSTGGSATAILFALLLPDTLPYWQMALAISFGVLFGEQIFGGRGRNFLNPVAVGMAFLMFSFPNSVSEGAAGGVPMAVAAALGGVVLLGVRLLSWRAVLGVILGLGALMLVTQTDPQPTALLTGSLAVGLIFLIGDPVASAATNAGRWIYGGMAGGLIVLVGLAGPGPGSLHSLVFASLLASIFAPLIDQVVIRWNVFHRKRRARHG